MRNLSTLILRVPGLAGLWDAAQPCIFDAPEAPKTQPGLPGRACQWRYQPTLLNGEAVEVDTTIQMKFTLLP